MPEPELRGLSRDWLRYAREDLEAAEVLCAQERSVPRQVVWNAQQAAEKAIKALLVAREITFPFTHDLDELVGLLPSDSGARAQMPDVTELTTWAGRARYPGEEEEPTEANAAEAIAIASQVVDIAKAALVAEGLE